MEKDKGTVAPIKDPNLQAIDDATARHGEVVPFEFDDGSLIILAKPNLAHVEYKRFVNVAADKDADKAQGQEDLALACTVYPDQGAARTLLRRWPACVGELAAAARELMSGGMRRLGKVSKKPNETTT